VNIVILDACRNNPLARDFRSVATSQGFAEIRTKPKGTFISFSTAPGEVAVDGDAGHSPFAAALAQTMQQPGLDLPEVFQRVREKVLVATEERQTPWDSSSLVKSFYFIPQPEAPATDALVADAAPTPTPVQVADARMSSLAPLPGLVSTTDRSATDSLAAKPVFVTMTRSLYAKPGSRLRAEPSTDASVIAKLPANAEIRAVARSKDGDWYEVATRQGQTAYIHADAVSDYRAAPPKRAATVPAYAAAPKPSAVRTAPHAKTGIQVVDQALNWLSSNSAGAAPPVTRSSR